MKKYDIIDFDEQLKDRKERREDRREFRREDRMDRRYGRRDRRGGRKVGIVILIIILILVALYVVASVYFTKHFMYKTEVNGIDASFMTADEVQTRLQDRLEEYVLTLEERGGKSEQIRGTELNIHGDFDTKITDALREQSALSWITKSWSKKEVNVDAVASYDADRLSSLIGTLDCMDESQMTKSRSASISAEQTDGVFTIVDEVYGTEIKEDELRKAVGEAVDSLADSIDLSKAGCYKDPKYTKDSDEVKAALESVNKMTGMTITYDMKDIDPVVNGADTIRSWINISKKMKVSLDEDKIAEFVDEFAKKYNTSYTPRKFTTASGEEVTLPGGYYGWRLDKSAEREALISEVQAGKDVSREPHWYRTAASHTSRDYGNTYAEVDISMQEMWFFENGNQKLNSSVVTGDETKGRATPRGMFAIMYKEKDATLNGEDYSSPVSYFMPFETNVGFHDATWRSDFGGSIYKGDGSHGCVNMPFSAAKSLFSMIEKGTPVIVHD